MIWIQDKPLLDGKWYWWRPLGDSNKNAIPINASSGYGSSYDNIKEGEWSHCPIPFPDETIEPERFSKVAREQIRKGKEEVRKTMK